MAITYQSTNNSGYSTGTSSVVTKPTGLAVGDLMIAYFFQQSPSSPAFPSGFTLIGDIGVHRCAYKYADSSDVAASNFTFTNGASTRLFSAITRITEADSGGTIQYNEGFQNNTTAPSIAASITPTVANSMIMQFWNQDTSTGATSSYAIATDNPTWTEGFDVLDGTTYTCSMAYATRTATTATGNASASGGSASTDWVVMVISIPPTIGSPGEGSASVFYLKS